MRKKKRYTKKQIRRASIASKIAIGTGLAAALGLKGYQVHRYRKTHGGPTGRTVTGSLRYL